MEPQASLDQILKEIDDPDQTLLYNPAAVLQSVDSPPSLLDNMNGFAPQISKNGYNQNLSPVTSAPDAYQSVLPTFSQSFPVGDCAGAAGRQQEYIQTAQVQLYIIEEPIERCRFRYRAEQGPHGSLKSASSKKSRSCPKVQMVGYSGAGAYVVAKLYTNETEPRLHVNDLWGSNCQNGFSSMPVNDNQVAAFANLGIMRQKEKEINDVLLEKYIAEYTALGYQITDQLRDSLKERANKEQVTLKDCLHSVRIGFQGFFPDCQSGSMLSTPLLLSQPVFNSQNAGFTELRIAEVSRSSGTCNGGDSVWMRCAAKVRRDQIKIRFHEPSTGWEADGVFSPTEVYEQILVIFKTPPYRDIAINERVHVNMHIYRNSDGEYSPPVDFIYLPNEEGPQSKKRKLVTNLESCDDSMSGPGASAPPPPPPPQNHASEMNAYMPSGNTNHNRADLQPNAASDFMPAAAQRPRLDPGDHVPLGELKINDEACKKMQGVLGQLWETQLQALRTFSSEGDPKALVTACKQLIGWQDEDGDSALHVAVKNKQPFALKTLLTVLENHPDKGNIVNCKNARKQTPLHLAVRYNDADCAHYLIAAGAERTHMDSTGNTVVHYLADTFTEDIYKDILFPPEDTVAGKQRVDLGQRNNAGQSPLHLAVKRLRLTLIENLLEAGAPVDTQDRNTGLTALMVAVQSNDLEAANLLLQYNASGTCTAMDGSTALHWAVRNKHEPLICRLMEAGANPMAKTAYWSMSDENMDTDTLMGDAAEKFSAMDIAIDNNRIIQLLKGENIEPLPTPPSFRRPSYKQDDNGTSSSPRPPKVRFETAEEGLPSDIIAQGRPNFSSTASSSTSSSSLAASPSLIRSTAFTTASTVAALKDDLGSLDFVTRLRLSKHLDLQNRWEKLADALSCQHMIEFITVCSEADETSSPTMVLLDQYEQMPGACVPSLLNALTSIGQSSSVDVIVRAQQGNVVDPDLEEDGLLTEAAGGSMEQG